MIMLITRGQLFCSNSTNSGANKIYAASIM